MKSLLALFPKTMKGVFFLLVVLVLFTSAVYLYEQKQPSQFSRGNPFVILDASVDLSEAQVLWTQAIDAQGEEGAYTSFKDVYSEESPGTQHQLAHVFGKLLYEKAGLNGIAVCDSNFSYGCFHEFLGQAIHAEGLAIVPELDRLCTEHLGALALGCQHGIGHGITTYLGYEYEQLPLALRLCDELPTYDPIGGCKGGVFMEFNFRTVLGEDGEVRPQKEGESVYHPCDTLDDMHLSACYYWHPQWWQSVFREEGPDFYGKFGLWCEALPEHEYQMQCYRGIGNNAPGFAGWTVEGMVELCSLMPSSDGEIHCRGAASAAFGAIKERQAVASEICDGLAVEAKKSCLTIAELPDAGAEL